MPNQPIYFEGPHQGQPILHYGQAIASAQAVMIMLHGRGAPAYDILGLADQFEQNNVAYLAPQAQDYTWYPNRFMAPMASNEPHLSSALVLVGSIVESVVSQGMPHEKIMVLGFSQGACLALEYAARNARRYGGIVGLTGGVIGPDGTSRDYVGSLAGTPIFMGSSDIDPHIPLARFEETAALMTQLGGTVDKRIYPNMGHMINMEEIMAVRDMLAEIVG